MLYGKLSRVLRRLRSDEDGVALAAVIGLMAVGVLITTLIMSSVISGYGQTTSTRAGVQAQAAAEAGAAAAYAGLQTAQSCTLAGGVYTSTTTPIYRATVWTGSGSTWTQGCPSGTGQVRIISTGTADSKGVAGNGNADKAYVEKIYGAGTAPVSGSAVYVANGTALNAFTVTPASGTGTGDVKMPSGNFSCTGTTTITGNVLVGAGTGYLTNSCRITGSLKVSSSMSMDSSAYIGGDMVAAGGSFSMYQGTHIVGNVYVNGNIDIFGTVDGNIEATGNAIIEAGAVINGKVTIGGTLTSISGSVGGNVSAAGTGTTSFTPGGAARVGGNLSIGGALSTWGYNGNLPSSGASDSAKAAYYIETTNNWVVGTVSYQKAGLTVPTAQPAPVVPAWVNWTYKYSDFQAAGFTQQLTWPSSWCSVNNYDGTNPGSGLYPFWQQVLALTTPTVIVVPSACSQLLFSSSANINWKFKTDLAFVGNGFTFENMTMDSDGGTNRKAYFLVPDGSTGTAGPQPGPGGCSINTNSAVTVGAHLAIMAYTPCTISINNQSKWRGQFYAGAVTDSANDGITYLPIGIPGTNLDGGSGGSGSGGIGALISSRNRSDNGE